MVRKIVFTVLTLSLLFLSQRCKTVEEEPDYTYSIDSVWWSDSIDANHDGFTSYRKLNVNVHLKEDVSRPIVARIFYQPIDASDFSFYAFSEKILAVGKNGDNLIAVSIGKPNKELLHGYYNFRVDIYEEGGSRLEARTGKKDSLTLCNNAFEKTETDNNYSLNVFWKDAKDNNNNGYYSHAYLVLDADIDANVTRSLSAQIFYKPSDQMVGYAQEPYYEILFTITGTTPDDTVSVPVGFPPDDFPRGEYDFKVELFEANEAHTLIAIAEAENTPQLKEVKFETEDEDSYHFQFANIWWSDSTDLDKDSSTSQRKLHFDVNVDEGASFSVYAKVFQKLTDSTDYHLYDSTAAFNISGASANDAYSVIVGSSKVELDSASYDFLISIYEAINDTTELLRVSASASSFDQLKSQKFETSSQDSTGVKP